jgi:hypothetical protein
MTLGIKTKEQTTSSEGDQLKHATVESVSDEVGSSKGPGNRYMGWEERKARNDSRADDTGDIQIPIAIISTRYC